MTESLRNDDLRIQAGGETVTISWAERQELVGRLRRVGAASGLIDRFEAVGTSQAIELQPEDLAVLMDLLVAWQEGGGPPAPDGIRALAAMVWRARS